jgi:uncharacterized protein (DUF1501 family)
MNMLSRRQMFALGAGLVASTSLGGIPVALARAATARRFVVVILRGALDGLAAVPPYTDRDYRAVRGNLALAEPGAADGALDLDGRFGLHPALEPLYPMYKAREMAVVHAVATAYRSRSHFDGQDLLENGSDTPHATQDGWLNRALGLLGTGGLRDAGSLRDAKRGSGDTARLGLAVGQAVPLILRGRTPVASWAPANLPAADPAFLDRLQAMYAHDPVLGPALSEGLRAQAMADEVLNEAHTDAPMAQQPHRPRMTAERVYGKGARQVVALKPAANAVGKLLAAADGPRVAVLEMLGWDTHAGQGAATGRLAGVMKGLAEGLAELKASLGPAWSESAVVVVTEFGRTVAVNGTNGTDHGTGTVAFLLGGAVAGGHAMAGAGARPAVRRPRPRAHHRPARGDEGDADRPSRPAARRRRARGVPR